MKTRNYSMFKFSKHNRELKEKNIKDLMESMTKFGFISGRPILIDKTGYIIDGQNRFEAAKRLKIDVHYEILNGDPVEKMLVLNSTQVNWKLEDYVNLYVSQGIPCYVELLKFQEKYKLTLSSAIDIFFPGKATIKEIKKGVVYNPRENAQNIAEFILSCSHISYNKAPKFIRAIVMTYPKLDKKQLTKLKNNLIVIPSLASSSDFIIAFENVLNKGKRIENKIEL